MWHPETWFQSAHVAQYAGAQFHATTVPVPDSVYTMQIPVDALVHYFRLNLSNHEKLRPFAQNLVCTARLQHLQGYALYFIPSHANPTCTCLGENPIESQSNVCIRV